MRVLLVKDHDKLGRAGEVVTVKDGFARNLLIPAGVAVLADERNLRAVEAKRRAIQARVERERRAHQAQADRIAQLELVARVQVGEEDRMFGSVTSADLADLAAQAGVEIDRRQIKLDEPIKALGEYQVPVKLPSGVEAPLRVKVVKAEATP